MLEHYLIVKYIGDERHTALIREAELLRLILKRARGAEPS